MELGAADHQVEWVPPHTVARRLKERVPQLVEAYEFDLLLVHRDSEGQPPADRTAEIERVAAYLDAHQAQVPIVPIVMTEAWLLIDEAAIRAAASNPNGTDALPVGPVKSLEQIRDPKKMLSECLRSATGVTGRALKRFNRDLADRRRRVAELIEDFSPLYGLPAFQRLENDLRRALLDGGWTASPPH